MPLVWHETHPAAICGNIFFFFFGKKNWICFPSWTLKKHFPSWPCCVPLALSLLLEQLKLKMLALTIGCPRTFTFQKDALN